MSAHVAAKPAHSDHAEERRDVLTTIVAAIISGLGILGVAYWLITLNWIYFPSVLLVALGCYLLFTRLTGPDHA